MSRGNKERLVMEQIFIAFVKVITGSNLLADIHKTTGRKYNVIFNN